MIRQAITCDICGTEKKQAKHWFVAYLQAGEFRVSGWQAQAKLRAGTQHLCGQTCLHKLVDEFMAGTLVARPEPAADTSETTAANTWAGDSPVAITAISPVATPSPTMPAASFPLQQDLEPIPFRPSIASQPQPIPAPVPISAVPAPDPLRPVSPKSITDSATGYAPRRWRAEAWQREREREVHPPEHRTGLAARFRKSS